MEQAPKTFILTSILAWMALGICPPAAGAQNDNNVEWFGVFSDPGWRNPLHPGKGQSFTVDLRVFRGDITGARVRTWDGSEHFSDMVWVRNDGPYDIWRGTVVGTSADFLYYRFEIRDGTDTDCYNALGMWDDVPTQGDFLIDTTPLGKYPLGATKVAGGTVFRVWAPNAASASVAGSFNSWSSTANPLAKSAGGIWQALVSGAAAGSQYKYVFDGTIWRTDPRARAQVNSVGNSIVVDPGSYKWGDGGWATPPFEDLILYELHVGSFSGEGDGVANYPGRFRDAADRHLDHLVELGVNAVELMPVNEFAGDRSWGYNPAFLYAVESYYGSPDDLRYLVDRCHQKGIAVLFDVVYNHMGASDLTGNILEYDGKEIYFYPSGNSYRETPWGPRPDYGRVEVRDFIRDNVRFCLEEFHADGLRLDASAYINVNAEGWQLLKEIGPAADAASLRAIVTAEHLPNDSFVTKPISEGGAGIDAQWNDAFHDNLRQAIQDAAFGDPSMAAVAAGINHFGLGGGTQVVNYIESHDEAANNGRVPEAADSLNRSSEWAQGRSRVAAALVLLSAGIPMLLQGQEFLEDRRFGDGRENRIQWANRDLHAGFFRFMKDLVRLRRNLPALKANSSQNVFHVNDGAEVIALHRWTASGGDVVAVVSLSNKDMLRYDLGFPQGGTWYEILNGESSLYGGRDVGNAGQISADGPPLHGMPRSASIVIPRMGVLVFAREKFPPVEKPGFIRGDCNGDSSLDISDPVRTLGILFLGDNPGDCTAVCDGNGDKALDISDAVYVLGFLFLGSLPPPPPWPACAVSEIPAGLSCSRKCPVKAP